MAWDKICSTTFTAKVGEEIINEASYNDNHVAICSCISTIYVCNYLLYSTLLLW